MLSHWMGLYPLSFDSAKLVRSLRYALTQKGICLILTLFIPFCVKLRSAYDKEING